MNKIELFNRLKGRYFHKIEKKYVKTIKRKQLNFNCSEDIILATKVMAATLEVPYCFVAEHLLQVGSYHILQALKDPQKQQKLQEHLVKVHLLGSELLDDESILKLWKQPANDTPKVA
jgi:hypothetical protein